MTFTIEVAEQHDSILPRTHYTFRVDYEGTTPSRRDVKTKAQLHVDDDKDNLIIRNFPSKHRGKAFSVEARQYHDEDAMELLEHDDMLDKNTFGDADDEEDES